MYQQKKNSDLHSSKYFQQYFLYLFVLFIPVGLHAQFGFIYDSTLSVSHNGATLQHPWSGGMNYVQMSNLDFNYDGLEDLFVFDKSNHQPIIFKNNFNSGQNNWEYVYQADTLFPEDLKYRTQIVDYNGDNKGDIWTYGLGGLKVYKNTGNLIDGLKWELSKEILKSNYVNGESTLFISSDDIPAIVDIDGDGDIDILTFRTNGETLEYHQNQSMELYGHSDSLVFTVMNECWGKFREDPTSNQIILNDTDFPCTGSSVPNPEISLNNNSNKAHQGSTILALDHNGSGVMDLIIGDVNNNGLTMLINGGLNPNTDSPITVLDTDFPSYSVPAEMETFPVASLVDLNFDGINDLIVSGNAVNISAVNNSVQAYLNTSLTTAMNFEFERNDFLQSESIDVGKGSVPVVVDINEDGLHDLLIANFYSKSTNLNRISNFTLYTNIGTPTLPKFELTDTNYLTISSRINNYRIIPTFGDIDNDNDLDMVLGSQDGTTYLIENISTGSGSIWSSSTQVLNDLDGNEINPGQYSFPQFVDINNDQLLDLIIGSSNGKIAYYENKGTMNNPSFKLISSAMGNVNLGFNSKVSPHFLKTGDSLVLFCGGTDGKLHYYTNIGPTTIFSKKSSNYLNISTGELSSFFVNDIDNDSNLNLFVGHDLGGLYHFEADPLSTVSIDGLINEKISIYPNPAQNFCSIKGLPSGEFNYAIIDLNGKQVSAGKVPENKQVNLLDIPNGFYYLVLKNNANNHLTVKLSVQ